MEMTVNLADISLQATRPLLVDGVPVARLMLVDSAGSVARFDAATFEDVDRLLDGANRLRDELAAARSALKGAGVLEVETRVA